LSPDSFTLWLGIIACGGSVVGSMLAAEINGALFNRILAVIMLLVVAQTLFRPFGKKNPETQERLSPRSKAIAGILFFFIGIYGGFIQAGAGLLIMSVLRGINGFSLLKSNQYKVFVVLLYTSVSIGIFLFSGKINWQYGLTLALGNMTGAWISSRLSVRVGENYIRGFMMVSVVALAVKLFLT